MNVSLSTEVGYQRRSYSTDTWTWEIRPIVDKQLDRWYLAFNPALERSFHGLEVSKGVTFSPNVKVSYDVTKKVTVGFEYYGAVGSITGFDPLQRPAAGHHAGPRPEPGPQLGIQLRRRHRHDRQAPIICW